MSNSTNPSKSGWYVTEAGEKKYWDGNSWLDDKPKINKPQRLLSFGSISVPAKKFQTGVLIALLAVGSISVLASVNISKADKLAELSAQNKKVADEKAAADAAAAAEKQAYDDEVKWRKSLIRSLERGVKSNASEQLASGWFSGPQVYDVTCDPVSGFIDDMLETTGTFSCFAATEKAGGRSYHGYIYEGLVNWDTGRWSFQLQD